MLLTVEFADDLGNGLHWAIQPPRCEGQLHSLEYETVPSALARLLSFPIQIIQPFNSPSITD